MLNRPDMHGHGLIPAQATADHDTAFPDEAAVYATIDELIEANQGNPELLPYLRAWREVGFLLSEENMHMFTDQEINDFSAAVERYENQAAN